MNESPPYLENYYPKYRNGIWVGENDPYGPQLTVERGPVLDKIQKAAKIILYITSRTADMMEDEQDDIEGEIEVEITEVFKSVEGESVHFLAYAGRTHHSFLCDVDIWVRDYDGEQAAADFFAS